MLHSISLISLLDEVHLSAVHEKKACSNVCYVP